LAAFNRRFVGLPEGIKKLPIVEAVLKFYENREYVNISLQDAEECLKIPGCNLTFYIEGLGGVLTENPDVKNYVTSLAGKGVVNADSEDGEDMADYTGVCLITGEKGLIQRKHGRTPINKDTKSLVAIQKNSGYDSYGKQQAFNCPISPQAEFAYTTALNVLLKSGSNRVQIADTTIVFWAQKKDETFDLESEFAWVFTSDKDDPDKGAHAVRSVFNAVESGRLPPDEGNRFYVLGLAPNAARISVRFWKTGTIRDFAEKIYRHFRDFEIIRPVQDRYEFLPLYQVLGATVLDYKMDNVPPNLAGAVVTSILDGAPYPRTLLHQCVRRIRAEQSKKDSRTGKPVQNVNRTRAAILKACVNRFNRIYHPQNKEVLVALDRSNTDTGYRIGRLFAVLEKIQEESSPGINATIRDRFYGAASSTPVTVFPRLLKLKNHHLPKILNPGRRVNLEKEIQEIVDTLTGFPPHLTLDEQAMFAIGYYHQRQDFFTSKKEMNIE